MRDSSKYIQLMGRPEIDKLLLSLSKTLGLTAEEALEEREDLFHVDWEFVPERLKE